METQTYAWSMVGRGVTNGTKLLEAKMKKKIVIGIIGISLLLIVLVSATAVVTTYMTKQEYIETYPKSKILAIYNLCDGEVSCMKEQGRIFECLEIVETDFLGNKLVRKICIE